MTAWILKRAGEMLAPFSPERRLAILGAETHPNNQRETNGQQNGAGNDGRKN